MKRKWMSGIIVSIINEFSNSLLIHLILVNQVQKPVADNHNVRPLPT